VFPALAAEALAEHSPHGQIDPWEIIRWLFASTHILRQQDLPGEFGDPPITLYSGPRFHLDIYFWLDGTTSVPQHAFCGAFQVLLGSSLHSHYSFRDRQQLNQHFAVGCVVLESVELLEQGAIKRILPGAQYIHSLFHLDRPSATICARTYHTASGAPQYNYYKPCFAADPFFKEPLSLKQTQSAALLLKMQHPETDALLGELLARSDFQTAFAILDLARGHLTGNGLEQTFGLTTGADRFQRLLEIARRRHGSLVDLISSVFEEAQRQHHLISRRAQITSNEHRFFLALLLNIPERAKILELVAQRFPERDPVDTITDWVEELATTRMWGASEPNVLGIDNFDEDYLFVFRCLLRGLSIEQLATAYAEEYAVDLTPDVTGKLEKLGQALRRSMLFKAILFDAPLTAHRQAAAEPGAVYVFQQSGSN
jgi:hypothetical protein